MSAGNSVQKTPLPNAWVPDGGLGIAQAVYMNTTAAWLILLILLSDMPAAFRLAVAPPPRQPMQTVETGLVVLDMDIDPSGKPSQIETVQGMAPFVGPSLDSVRQWTFQPLKTGQTEVPATAVFLFRARTVLPDRPVTLNLAPEPSAGDSPPRPMTMTDPGYPVQSVAEGVVILQLQIDSRGRVQKTEIIRNVPSLTSTAVHAVSQWRFGPAKHAGNPVPGTAIVAISFLRPVLSN
jgi:outer membrane biosynthesis protein TonB